MNRLATVGVYGFAVDDFLDTLREADVRLLLDVRQRRGVRGPQYACSPPTTELRQLQYREDERLGVGKPG